MIVFYSNQRIICLKIFIWFLFSFFTLCELQLLGAQKLGLLRLDWETSKLLYDYQGNVDKKSSSTKISNVVKSAKAQFLSDVAKSMEKLHKLGCKDYAQLESVLNKHMVVSNVSVDSSGAVLVRVALRVGDIYFDCKNLDKKQFNTSKNFSNLSREKVFLIVDKKMSPQPDFVITDQNGHELYSRRSVHFQYFKSHTLAYWKRLDENSKHIDKAISARLEGPQRVSVDLSTWNAAIKRSAMKRGVQFIILYKD